MERKGLFLRDSQRNRRSVTLCCRTKWMEAEEALPGREAAGAACLLEQRTGRRRWAEVRGAGTQH